MNIYHAILLWTLLGPIFVTIPIIGIGIGVGSLLRTDSLGNFFFSASLFLGGPLFWVYPITVYFLAKDLFPSRNLS